MRIAICITTFHRAKGLQNLLSSLTRLRRKPGVSFNVIVVDNDAAESAQSVVHDISPKLNYPVTYVVERKQGLTYARNTALERGLDADAIAFLDDDEETDPEWLDEVVNTLDGYSADIVNGPVLSRFSSPPADWIVNGGFFDRPRPVTGTVLTEARTGNVCMRTEVLRTTGIRFDHQFAFSGGEDADFFRRLHAAGVRIVASDAAIAHETIPTSRANARWILLRALRIANSDARFHLKRSSSAFTRIGVLALGGARIAKGTAAVLAAPLVPKHVFMRNLQGIFRGLGACMAGIGLRYEEYKRSATPEREVKEHSSGAIHA
jgi:glycosyltransferase involved in cell wall biosynthesis